MIKEANSLNSVAEFHRLFGHPVLENPTIPSPERCALRINLLREELAELEEAIAQGDLTEVADAFCDLQYVLSGAILEFGFGDIFHKLFDEVQRSNMSKACKTLEEAEASLAYYRNQGIDCYMEQKDNLYLIFRHGDNKTLKSRFYSEAQLEPIIKELAV